MAKDSSPNVEQEWGLSLPDATPRKRKSDGNAVEVEVSPWKPGSAMHKYQAPSSTCTPSTSLTRLSSKNGTSYGAVNSSSSNRTVIANQNDFITVANKRPERVIKEAAPEKESSIPDIDISKNMSGTFKIDNTESGESILTSGFFHILGNLVVAFIIVGGAILVARLFLEATMTRNERKVMYVFFCSYVLFIILNNLYHLGGSTSVTFTDDSVVIKRPYFFGLMSNTAELPRSDFLYASRGQGSSVEHGGLVRSTFTCIGCGVIVSWVLSWLMCAPKDTFHQHYTFPELFFSQTHKMQIKAKELKDIIRIGKDEQGESGLIIVQLRNIPHVADVSHVECERMCQLINMKYGDLPNAEGNEISSV